MSVPKSLDKLDKLNTQMQKKIILLFYLVFSLNLFAQQQIEKSKDIVVVLGRKYYVHTVKEGETIYSLSKVYEVPQEDILLINKEVVGNLQEGSALRIPIIDENYTPAPLNKVTFTEHKVEKNESLYSIAKQYNTTQDNIIRYNPQIENGLTKGMVLKIPIEEKEEIVAKDKFFEYHQIKNGDNLQIIALQYGVSVEEILEFNENAKELVVGEILAIPIKKLSEEQKAILKFNNSFEPNFFDVDPNYFEDPNYPPCTKFIYDDTMTFKIAIAFPFFINENYNYSYDAVSSPKNAHYYKNTKIFYEYFQGIILAVDKLKKEGMNLRIYLYDTKADSSTTAAIFKKYELSKMDLIIGPVYSNNYSVVNEFSKKNKINVVSPLSNKIEVIENNPFVFQITPDNKTVLEYTAMHIAMNTDTSVVFIINNGTKEQKLLADTFKYFLSINVDNVDSLRCKDVTFSKFITPYQQNLLPEIHNIVVITSTDEVEVSAILNNLNSLVAVSKYKITVYALPVIAGFTKLQSDWIANLNIHFASMTYKDLDNWKTREFRNNYNSKFGSYPTMYAYMGYDISYYFISALRLYGKYFQFCLGENDEFMQKGIFMKFDFERCNETGGFENRGHYMLYYNDNMELLLKEEPPSKFDNRVEK